MLSNLFKGLSVCLVILSLVCLWGFWQSVIGLSWGREKVSHFESGLELTEEGRSPFSVRFFLILLMFLIFDVEVSFFLVSFYLSGGWWGVILFFWGVLLGFLEEWRRGCLSWEG